MSHSDPLIAMRAADATEKATRTTPGALAAHRTQLFELAERSIQQEVRWHLAQLLPRLPLDEAEARRVGSLLEGYLADPSQIVRQGPVGQGRSRWQTHQRRAS